MSAALTTLDEALDVVRDGSSLGIGGSVLARKPVAALHALARRGVSDLELIAFTGSIDVELLLGAGALRAVRASHVSLGEAGRAERFERAVVDGTIEDLEESEWMLLGGLRAAAAGIPFLPTRAALGSELVERRGWREVESPYSGERMLAVPALAPDVAIIHAWRADARGNVQMPWPPDHLWDVDVLLARAARRTIVTVERVVSSADVARHCERTQLLGFEIDAIVEMPGGAAPTASSPDYDADLAAVTSVSRATIGPNRVAASEEAH